MTALLVVAGLAYFLFLALALLFNRGAHRKPSPRRDGPQCDSTRLASSASVPARGTSLSPSHDSEAADDGPAVNP